MANTKANNIVTHLQFYYQNYFEKVKKIDLDNPVDLCGVSLFTDYILRRLGDLELNDYIIEHIGWDAFLKVFDAIEAQSHFKLLSRLKDFKPRDGNDDSIKNEVIYEWCSYNQHTLYNKCVTYLNKHIDSPKIDEILAHFPPLPTDNDELLAACEVADYEWIKNLLSAGTNPNILSEDNYSPLEFVWFNYRKDFNPDSEIKYAILLLIESGANPCFENHRRIFDESITYFPPEFKIAEAFLKKGKDINDTDESIAYKLIKDIQKASNATRKRIYKAFFNVALNYKVDVNKPFYREMPITIAEDRSIIYSLLKNGAKPEVQADNGLYYMTPLMHAVFSDDLKRVKFWLGKGLDINKRMAFRFTKYPLTIAPGLTAFDIAKHKKSPEMQKFLQEQGAISGEPTSWLIQIIAYENTEMNKDEMVNLLIKLLKRKEYNFVDEKFMRRLDVRVELFIEENKAIKYIEHTNLVLIEETQQLLTEIGFKSELI